MRFMCYYVGVTKLRKVIRQPIRCPIADQSFVDKICEKAHQAQPEWGKVTPLERAKVLHKVAVIIRDNLEKLAGWETKTNGKVNQGKEARDDLNSSADTFMFYAGILPTIFKGDYFDLESDRFAYTRPEPYGVVGCIGAWNYPINLICRLAFQTAVWKVSPALAAGNSVVYKPSPFAPGSPVILGEILSAAGLPVNIYNVVQGEGETGQALCENEFVRKVSFTGSVATGKKIQQACAAKNIKPVTLELGGKSPFIVFEDSCLDKAVHAAVLANFLNQGEVCTNATRVFVQKSIAEQFQSKLLNELEKIKVGDPLDEANNVGALINEQHLSKVARMVENAVKEGAQILRGGKRLHPTGVEDGFYFDPVVLTNLNDKMEIVRDEIFGPVLLLLPFETEEEVVSRANNTHYGLATGLYSNCLKRAHRVAAQLEAGTVFINTYNDTMVHVPFGGYKKEVLQKINKNSGHGRENSVECLKAFYQIKSIYVNYGDNVQHNLD
ncbi:putative betaine-aldehyde dehydrogenase [Aphelenchoides bicaudatus]|nr:putative betaine-aldehyde dehydrogenase [Aphelenchoides bicaudatus]